MVVQWRFKSKMGIKKNMIQIIINLIYFPYQQPHHNTQSPFPSETHQISSWWRWDQLLPLSISMSCPSYSLIVHWSKLIRPSSLCTVGRVTSTHLELMLVLSPWPINCFPAFWFLYWNHQLNIVFFLCISHLKCLFAPG